MVAADAAPVRAPMASEDADRVMAARLARRAICLRVRVPISGHSNRIAAAVIRPSPEIEQKMSKARAGFRAMARKVRQRGVQFGKLAFDALQSDLGLALRNGQRLRLEAVQQSPARLDQSRLLSVGASGTRSSAALAAGLPSPAEHAVKGPFNGGVGRAGRLIDHRIRHFGVDPATQRAQTCWELEHCALSPVLRQSASRVSFEMSSPMVPVALFSRPMRVIRAGSLGYSVRPLKRRCAITR